MMAAGVVGQDGISIGSGDLVAVATYEVGVAVEVGPGVPVVSMDVSLQLTPGSANGTARSADWTALSLNWMSQLCGVPVITYER